MTEHKRRRPGEGSVTRRKNGTYVAVIELSPEPVTGKRRRRFVYAKTEQAAVLELKKLRRQLDDSGDLPTSDWTVGKWLAYWLEHIARARVKPGTWQSYKSAVDNYLIPTLGNRPLSRLSPEHIRKTHDYVRGLGCNSTTARKAHRVLSIALNDAVKEGKATRNMASLVRAPAKAVSRRGALTWDEGKKVLTQAAQDERTGARWLAAFLLGARQGELLGLRWSYVDLDTGMVDLAWSLQPVRWAHGCSEGCGKIARACPDKRLPIPDGYEYEQLDGNLCLLRPKTDSSRREVPLPDYLWEALKLHAKTTGPNPHGLVWTRPDGRPINPRDDWEAWKTLLAAAKVRSVTLHEARHSTATWLGDSGIPENVAESLMGHSDVRTTRSYTHLSPAIGRAALNQLSERLELT